MKIHKFFCEDMLDNNLDCRSALTGVAKPSALSQSLFVRRLVSKEWKVEPSVDVGLSI